MPTSVSIVVFPFLVDSYFPVSWWRHQVGTFSALLAICAGNSPVPGEFPTQRPVTRSFDVYLDLSRDKRLSKQLWGWWFETLWPPLWRHRNVFVNTQLLFHLVAESQLYIVSWVDGWLTWSAHRSTECQIVFLTWLCICVCVCGGGGLYWYYNVLS